MVHTLSTHEQGENLPYLQKLWDTLFISDIDLGSKLEQLFAEETDEFDLDYAFLSRIDLEAETQQYKLVHGKHGIVETHNTVPLAETYCRKTIADPEGTVVVSDALAEEWDEDPAYEKFELGSYVGTTVTVADELYGTLCFASSNPREEPITDEEAQLVEMHGQWVAYELNQTGPPSHDTVSCSLAERKISSAQIDAMMDALRNPVRRSVLLTLVDSTQSSIDDIKQTTDSRYSQVDLHHNHLPKLEGAGYIERNHESNTISRGQNFLVVEPLVRLLKEYKMESMK